MGPLYACCPPIAGRAGGAGTGKSAGGVAFLLPRCRGGRFFGYICGVFVLALSRYCPRCGAHLCPLPGRGLLARGQRRVGKRAHLCPKMNERHAMKRVSIHRTYGHRPPSAASPRGALRRFLLSFLFLIYTSVCAFPLPGWKPVYLPFDSLARLCEQGVEEARSPEYRRRVRSLYAIATEHHHLRVLQWRAMYWDAFGLWRTGHADSAAVVARQALAMVDSADYEYDCRRLQRLLLNCTADTLSYFDAYKAYRSQLRYYERVGDTLQAANTCVTLGNIFCQLDETGRAFHYLRRADTLYARSGQTAYRVKNSLNLANALYAEGSKGEAVALLRDVVDRPEARADTAFLLEALASLTSYTDTAAGAGHAVSRAAYRLARAYGHERPLMQASINLGANYLREGHPDSALACYRRVCDYLQRHNDSRLLVPALRGMYGSFSLLERWDSACIYLATAGYYEDSLRRSGNLSEVYRQESRLAIDGYEEALARERGEARTHRLVAVLVVAVVVLGCGLVCLWFWSQRRKALARRQLQELENKELAARLENEELRFRLELDSKNRELTSSSLMLIEKNQALDELMRRIKDGGEAGEIAKRTVLELRNQIRAHAGGENEWVDFRTHFEQVHPDFFLRLKERFPALTEYELRLCAYLRTGMSGKQIAMMLSVQPESIKKSRTRLRRKLALGAEDSLEDFLRRLGVEDGTLRDGA